MVIKRIAIIIQIRESLRGHIHKHQLWYLVEQAFRPSEMKNIMFNHNLFVSGLTKSW